MEPNVQQQEPSLRDDIAASIATLETPDTDKTPVVDKTLATDKTPAKTIDVKTLATDKTPAKTVDVKAHTRTVTDKVPMVDKTPATDKAPVAASIKDTPPITTEKITLRAPASWKPETREKWAALPTEVKSEVLRREHEVNRVLQETAQARGFVEQFQQVASPFQHYIAMEGGDPIKAFGDYLRTASLLRGGTPAEKANAVASAIATYAVDVQLLDQALSQVLAGKPLPQQQAGGQPQYRDPRVDELLGTLQRRQQEDEQRITEELTSEVVEFASNSENEFFEDVRPDISDLLRIAAERGQKMTLKEAYDKACKLNPDITKVLEQRAQAAAEQKTKEDLVKKRAAASSINSQAPHQTGNAKDSNLSVREAIENSIQQLST